MMEDKINNQQKPTTSDIIKQSVPHKPMSSFDGMDEIIVETLTNRQLSYNKVKDAYYINKERQLKDVDINTIAIECRAIIQDLGIKGKRVSSSDVYSIIQSDNTPVYNPFSDYIDKISQIPLKEGVLEQFMNCIELDDHHPDFKEKVLKKWLGGIVGTLQGSYSVMTLVLIGGQGIGKTKFFRNLLPYELKDCFAEGDIEAHKDCYEKLCSNLIYYNDEFTSKNKTEASVFKNVSSADSFTYRRPYGRVSETRKRVAVLCGSANESDVISDHTGNRRILATRVKHIDHEALSRINIDEVYRELLELCLEDATWWHLSKEDIALLNDDTYENTLTDPYEERVNAWTEFDKSSDTPVSTSMVERHLSAHDGSYRPNSAKLSRALTRVYGKSVQKKVGGRNIRGYLIRLKETPSS